MKNVFKFFATMLAVLLVSTALPVRAAIVTVDGGTYTCDETGFAAALVAASSGDTVAFDCNGGAATVIDIEAQYIIDKNITIDGANGATTPPQGGNVTIRNASNSARVFITNPDISLTLNNLTVIHTLETGTRLRTGFQIPSGWDVLAVQGEKVADGISNPVRLGTQAEKVADGISNPVRLGNPNREGGGFGNPPRAMRVLPGGQPRTFGSDWQIRTVRRLSGVPK